jgi:hypothetical protein
MTGVGQNLPKLDVRITSALLLTKTEQRTSDEVRSGPEADMTPAEQEQAVHFESSD